VSARRQTQTKRTEEGIALLISIFILLLISVVAIALIVASGTESSLAGNYRSATGVYYAALAGLEEARGRLSTGNANSFKTTAPGFLPSSGPLAVCTPVYVINPVGGEAVAPWDPASTYPDTEFNQEFAGICSLPNPSPSTLSIWNRSPLNGLSFPGPLYKWVRINAVSEQSLNNLDTSPYDGTIESTPVYYDGMHLTDVPGSNPQVLEITALAVLPNGSQKLLQYLVAPIPLNFQAALTLDGNGVVFNTTPSNNFWVKGNDQYSALSCNPTPPAPAVTALGYTNSADYSAIVSQIPPGPPPPSGRGDHYTNGIATTPNVAQVTPSPNLTTVAGLNSLVQAITQNADIPPITPSGQLTDANNFMPAAMTATNPMTIVVNGDLTINGWHHHGYGLLLVTGEMTFDPDAFWHGIILVIGKGWFFANQGSSTGGHIEGALFIAKTTDPSGTPLPIGSPLGASRFDFTSNSLTPSGGNYYGVYYSNCWIQAAMPNLGYKILSFHEISQ
jgi:hypothetical protein